MPHIHCYLAKPALVWTMFITDLLIGIAYVGISVTLYALVRRVKVQFSAVVLCFGIFIGACGATHFMEVWTLWNPDYWVSAGVKVVTAIASVGTGIYLFQLRHPIVSVVEAARQSETHRLKLEELTVHLQESKTLLEHRVQERTAALQSSQRNFERMFEIAPVAFAVAKTPSGELVHVNAAWSRLIGYPAEDAIGRTTSSLGVVENEVERKNLYAEFDEAGKVRNAELQIRTRSGDLRSVLCNMDLIELEGRAPGERFVLATLEDVTERKRASAELREAIRARDEFLSIASHELKTPLSSLKLQAQLAKRLRDRGDMTIYETGKVDRLIEQTDRQTNRLSRLVDDMLDISRIRTGKLSVHREQLDLSALVADVIDRMSSNFKEAGVAVELERTGPIEGQWDRMRVEQILSNLLTNALKYGDKKPVRVRLEKPSRDRVRLLVRDEGIGISDEARDRIFERFERAVDANEVSGLGLGLFITREIVQAHGGKVWSESNPDAPGSTFIVELPLGT